ncbi:hypothetical protein Tco_1332289, partial [Tanacetum coccineum]
HRSSDHHSSPDFTSDSSSSGSSLDSSSDTSSGPPLDSLLDTSSVHSSGCDASGMHLVLLLPPTTSESSPDSSFDRSLDSSSLSAGPSQVQRFILTEDSREEHIKIGTADAEAVADLGIGDGVGAHSDNGIVRPVVDEDVPDHVTADGAVKITYVILGDLVQRFHDHTEEIPVHRLQGIKTAQRQLKAGQLIASGERASLTDRIRRLGWENQKVRALLSIERDRVDSLRHHMALSQKEFCQIRRDRNDTQRRLRRLESFIERHLGFRP